MPNPVINRRFVQKRSTVTDVQPDASFFFNATANEYVQWGDSLDSVFSTGIFSLRAVVRRTTTGAVLREIFNKWNGTTNNRSWVLRFSAGNNLIFSVSTDGTVTRSFTTTNTFTSTSTWYDIVVSVDLTQALEVNRVAIYVNGVSQLGTWSGSGTSTSIFNGTSQIRIGAAGDGTGSYTGYINQEAITSDIITSSEVTTLYNGGLPLRSDIVLNNLVLLPNHDASTFDGTNWSVPDLSGSGLTGTSNLLLSADLDFNENPY